MEYSSILNFSSYRKVNKLLLNYERQTTNDIEGSNCTLAHFKNHAKSVNTTRGKIDEFYIEGNGTCNNHCALKGYCKRPVDVRFMSNE